MISVIIPTYKCPEALDICLESLIKGQKNENQLIVVVDGFYDINKEVLEKWSKHIDILNLEENVGLCRGTNLGVYNAKYDLVLIINDDNVAPNEWDEKLLKHYTPGVVLTPNQIEPSYSMFKQFVEKDLGRDPKTFDIQNYWEFEESISIDKVEENGGTLPFFMNKMDYLKIGGWDENYPLGLTADWEFFLKCQMVGLKMMRTYNCTFYHFESLSTRPDPEKSRQRDILQTQASEYFKYKWGNYIRHNPLNNLKYLSSNT
jgi:glycosyltransferase involved in cell wall biosynthesis